jgi:hypothetical protein
MVMQFNVVHASLREWEEVESIESKEEEEDQDVMCKIIIIEFFKQTRRKE